MGKQIDKLGNVLATRSKNTAKAALNRTLLTELGRVDGNLAVIPDSLPHPIPKGEYMVSLMLTGGFMTENANDHTHRLPKDQYRALKPGDRVLICWAGMEPVVVAIVVSS